MAFNHLLIASRRMGTAMIFHMRAKTYDTGSTQVCVKQLTLAYERSAQLVRKAPLCKGGWQNRRF